MVEWASSISTYGLGAGRDGELSEDGEKLLTAGDRGRGGSWDTSGTSGTGGGASEGERRVQAEPPRLCDFIEKPDRVRPLSPLPSQVAAFWGAVLGRSAGASRAGSGDRGCG
jgi:hypothetical protein